MIGGIGSIMAAVQPSIDPQGARSGNPELFCLMLSDFCRQDFVSHHPATRVTIEEDIGCIGLRHALRYLDQGHDIVDIGTSFLVVSLASGTAAVLRSEDEVTSPRPVRHNRQISCCYHAEFSDSPSAPNDDRKRMIPALRRNNEASDAQAVARIHDPRHGHTSAFPSKDL
jgi:hypothetical protein